jgi:hypothetical protein
MQKIKFKIKNPEISNVEKMITNKAYGSLPFTYEDKSKKLKSKKRNLDVLNFIKVKNLA